MSDKLIPNGEFVKISNYKVHVLRDGDINKPTLVFMSGSGTVAPVYDFKILYKKLVENFRIIVIEKFGYGYSDIFEYPCDIDSLVDYYAVELYIADMDWPFNNLGLWKSKYKGRSISQYVFCWRKNAFASLFVNSRIVFIL